MVLKLLERLIGNFGSMHLAMPCDIGYFYSMQVSLTHALASNRVMTYILAQFHQYAHLWREICKAMDTHPTCLEEIVHRDASDLGYCNASGLGAEGVLIDPNKYGINRF